MSKRVPVLHLNDAFNLITILSTATGYAFFGIYNARTKTWTFTIDNVLLGEHFLDRDNSTLCVTFNGKGF